MRYEGNTPITSMQITEFCGIDIGFTFHGTRKSEYFDHRDYLPDHIVIKASLWIVSGEPDDGFLPFYYLIADLAQGRVHFLRMDAPISKMALNYFIDHLPKTENEMSFEDREVVY